MVEHGTENAGVDSSSLSLGTTTAKPTNSVADSPCPRSFSQDFSSLLQMHTRLLIASQFYVVPMELGIDADSLIVSLNGRAGEVPLRDGQCRGIVVRRVPG